MIARSRIVGELLAIALFVALAALMTWPLAAHLDSAIAEPDDPFFTTWTLDWDYHATFGRAPLFEANIFYPAHDALAFSEHMIGVALPLFPLFAAGVAPLTIHNVAMLLGFAACGYAMFLLARWITGSAGAGIVAGIGYAFVGFRFHHLPHLHFVWSMWLPLVLLALLMLVRRPSIGSALLLAGTLTMNGLATMHWLVFGTLAAGIAAVVLAFGTGRWREWRFWLLLAGSFVVAGLIWLPFLVPYLRVEKLYGMKRQAAEVFPNGAEWRDWLVPNLQSKLYGRWSPAQNYGHERTLLPGFFAYVLALVGLVLGRRCGDRAPLWGGVVWLAVGALGARGLRGAFHTFLFEYVPGFRGIRMPVRWAMVSYVGLGVLVALGAAALLRNCRPLTKVLVTIAIAALQLFELRAAPIRWFLVPTEPRPLYEWIASTPIRGAVVELPLTQSAAYEYLWRATVHHRPLINGVSSYTPPHYERLTALYETDPMPDALLSTLEEMRCSLVVVHAGGLRERSATIRDWLRRSLQSGRLVFVRRFDAGTRADYVFALTRTEPEALRWRAAEVPDRAGRTPTQNAAIFLDSDGWTYVDAPIASVDAGPFGTIRGPLTVSRWAMAPAGIARVNLRFANGRAVVATQRFDRPDVKALLPWYPNDPRPGFIATVDAPPRGIDGDTDLQIELVDGEGHVRRQSPFWFRWKPRLAEVPAWDAEQLDRLLIRLDVHQPAARDRILEGTSAIEDFTPILLRDRESEPDPAFADRILTTLLGRPPDPPLARRYSEMLAHGTSRERVIEKVLTSPEFARVVLRAGRIRLD